MIKRTIKPAAGRSRVTPEEALAAARIVYRDGKTGRFVIVDGEHVRKGKHAATGIFHAESAKVTKGSSRQPSSGQLGNKKS